MVRMKRNMPETRTTYYLKPGQTLKNTKVSERSLALIVPSNVYERFVDYTEENHKVNLCAQREAKRLAALREATYNMSKSWKDTAQNIQIRRKEELLSRKKLEKADRVRAMKDAAERNALERAEIVKQAKELILYRKPQCRLINQALLTSECFRELDEQLKFQKTLKNNRKKLDDDSARAILEDVEKFHEEEKKKREIKLNKLQMNKEELEKQIEKNKNDLKKFEESIRKSEIEDLQNMSKEINDIKQKELQEALEKKESLKKMFLDAIEEKREYESKLQQEEEFQEKYLKFCRDSKLEMEKQFKEKVKNAKEDKLNKNETLAKKVIQNIVKRQNKEEKNQKEILRQLEEKKQNEDLKMIEERKQKREKIRLEKLEQKKHFEEEQEKRKKEEMDLKIWEALQRYKRDEFNKEWNLKHLEAERNKKLQYAKLLEKQMQQKNAEIQKAKIEDDDSIDIKERINATNEKVLAYGEKVLQESRHVRPIYPIEKTIEQFKREAGLIPPGTRLLDTEAPAKISNRKCARRTVCTKPVKDENEFHFA